MGQTAQNTPNSNVDTLQTLQESVSNSQVPSMTVAQAIEHFKSQREKLKKFLENEKNPELQKNAQNFLEALNKDIAVLQKQTNQDDRVTSIQQKLASLDFDLKKEQTPAPGVDIPVAKEAPKPLAVNIDNESVVMIQNFQTEAAAAFKKEISDENGNLTNQSIKKGLEFVAEVSNISSITLGDGKFDWLDKAEQEKLKEQLPAVRGVLGAIFMETLFGAGYVAAFNGDGTIVLKSKNTNNANTANTIEKEINTAFGRDPELSKTLRMGLLYADGDLLKYMQASADSKGQNISPNQQTPDEFLNYLHGRSKKEETQAADAIKASKNFFQGINLPEQMVAANYVPEISRELQVIMPQAQALIQREVNTQQNQGGNTNTSANMETTSAIGVVINTQYNGSWRDKSLEQSIAEHGKIGGTLEQVGYSWMKGASTLMSSPSAASVSALALVVSFFTLGFKKTIGTLFGLPVLIGGGQKLFDYLSGNKTSGSSKENSEKNGNLPTPPPMPTANPSAIAEVRKETHGEEGVELATNLVNNFKTTNHMQVLNYINGNKEVNLSTEQKQLLDDPKNAEIIKKDIERFRNDAIAKINGPYPPEFNVTQEQKNQVIASLEHYSVEQLQNFVLMTPEQMAQWMSKMAQYQLDNNLSLTPEQKTFLQSIIDNIGDAAYYTTMFSGVLFLIAGVMFCMNIPGYKVPLWFAKLPFTALKGTTSLAARGAIKVGSGIKQGTSTALDKIKDRIKGAGQDIVVGGQTYRLDAKQNRLYLESQQLYNSFQSKIVDGRMDAADFRDFKVQLGALDDNVFKNNTDFMGYLYNLNSAKNLPATFDELLLRALKKIS